MCKYFLNPHRVLACLVVQWDANSSIFKAHPFAAVLHIIGHYRHVVQRAEQVVPSLQLCEYVVQQTHILHKVSIDDAVVVCTDNISDCCSYLCLNSLFCFIAGFQYTHLHLQVASLLGKFIKLDLCLRIHAFTPMSNLHLMH